MKVKGKHRLIYIYVSVLSAAEVSLKMKWECDINWKKNLSCYSSRRRSSLITALRWWDGSSVVRGRLPGNSIWPKRFYTHGVSLGWCAATIDRARVREGGRERGTGGKVVELEDGNLQCSRSSLPSLLPSFAAHDKGIKSIPAAEPR